MTYLIRILGTIELEQAVEAESSDEAFYLAHTIITGEARADPEDLRSALVMSSFIPKDIVEIEVV